MYLNLLDNSFSQTQNQARLYFREYVKRLSFRGTTTQIPQLCP